MPYARQRAFSLYELMICLLVLALLGLIALPSYTRWSERNQNEALRNELLASLRAARTYSVENNQTTELCGSLTGQECDSHWQSGWRIQRARDGAGLHITQLGRPHTLHWSGFSSRIRFRPDGLSPTSNGTFVLCSRDAQAAWALIINRQGRVRSETQSEALQQRDSACSEDSTTNHRQ